MADKVTARVPQPGSREEALALVAKYDKDESGIIYDDDWDAFRALARRGAECVGATEAVGDFPHGMKARSSCFGGLWWKAPPIRGVEHEQRRVLILPAPDSADREDRTP